MIRRAIIAAALLGCALPPLVAAQASVTAAHDFCPARIVDFTPSGAPSTDLYCIELIPPPALDGTASGVVQLTPEPSPFGAAVTRDGQHRFVTTFFIEGLPDASAMGPYTTFIAWAVTPGFGVTQKLGSVRNGRVPVGALALNKFLILISAEAADTTSERRGPLVLRGMSASTRMRDPHFLMMAPRSPTAHGDHHAQHGAWVMPPHDPRVPMGPMGIEHLTPAVTPFLPGAGIDPGTVSAARPRELLRLEDGDSIDLVAQLVTRRIKGRELVMYGFNGQYPGPLIHVPQAATIVVNFENRTSHETAVHWHGVRLDNRFDGVPHVTQDPVPPGGSFRYVVHFPDAGIYWYHPHHREDVQQDLGLYGNLMVASPDPSYYGPADREEVLMLDDILLGDHGLVPYGAEAANFAVMGRFGNVMLINGEPRYNLTVAAGAVVRFHFTNASNTRVFNVSFDDARMKVVASDVGRFEREEWVESVVIAPAERYVVDVRFAQAGKSALTNRVQGIDHMMGAFVAMIDTLGLVTVGPADAERRGEPAVAAEFDVLRRHGDVETEVARFLRDTHLAPVYDLDLVLRDDGMPFELTQLMRLDTLYFNPVEWAGTMPMMDWLPTTREISWIVRESGTGAENEQIRWDFAVGDVVRLRLRNERHSLHAMQHPIHIHGQRFLVLSVNGAPVSNHAWKDTVLVPVGMEVELLLELSNPGRWMLHCHIAEHLEAGMQFVFEVKPSGRGTR